MFTTVTHNSNAVQRQGQRRTMSEESQQQPQTSDKELNFRKQEQMYQRQLQQAQEQRLELEKQLNEIKMSLQQRQQPEEDEIDDQPYVEPKTLKKKMDQFGQSTKSEIQKAMDAAKTQAKEELKQELWMEQNPDFADVLEKYADKFAVKAPRLAESILRMPANFERQKLVYENIKHMGLDKPEAKPSTIQGTVDANRRSPYYQPSGMGTAPYSTATADFSPGSQKNAYQKMKELQAKLRL